MLFSRPGLKWVIVLLPLAYFWFRLINNLWPEWTTNPQYGYGLLVPLLCIGLLIRRWHSFSESRERKVESGDYTTGLQDNETTEPKVSGQWSVVSGISSEGSRPWSVVLLFTGLAFLYLPTRLIEDATPEWRPIQWLLGIEAIGLTLCVIVLGKGRGWLRQLAFPLFFFFVAIPWPSIIEIPIIQTLTRASAAIVVELLGWADVPAMVHGNVIEVSTGMVGIDEACSGIRSFQSSLMISLFLGEFYRLSPWRRWLLIPAGFVFSMAFNVGRMFLLTLVAAKKGVPAISQYHDPAGFTIAILCTLGLWGLAWMMGKREKAGILKADRDPVGTSPSVPLPGRGGEEGVRVKLQSSRAEGSGPAVRSQLSSSQISTFQPFSFSVLPSLALSLIVWLIAVEAGVQLWYRHLESHLNPGPEWSLNFPQHNATLKELPISADTRYLLRYDEGKEAEWSEADGTRWQVFYCSWLPGRVAGYLAKRHTPEICLQATGLKMVSGPELTMMNVHGVELPVRSYVFEAAGGPINVFHCRWEAGEGNSAYVEHESARFNLIRGIWAGRGTHGQKVLEIILTGMDDPVQARAAMVRQLEDLIQVEKPEGSRDG